MELPGPSTTTAVESTTSPVNAAGETMNALTGVRFFAAFLVAVFHYVSNGRVPPTWQPPGLVRCGFIAVSFFFVLSGFIMTTKYAGAIFEKRLSTHQFLLRRVFRIYPVYFVALLLAIPIASTV